MTQLTKVLRVTGRKSLNRFCDARDKVIKKRENNKYSFYVLSLMLKLNIVTT